MTKEERLHNRIIFFYPDIDKLLQDKSVDEYELEAYMRYCEEASPSVKSYNDFKTYRELKNKCRTKGIESIMFRKDVINLTKKHFEATDRGYDSYDYIEVETKYGTFDYMSGRQID